MQKILRKEDLSFKILFPMFMAAVIAALLYAVSIRCFIQTPGSNMLAGGASGVALIISKLIARIGGNESTWYSIIYFSINIPLFILAFKKIGKLYAAFSIINVGLSALLIALIPQGFFSFMNLDSETDLLLIALFAGVLTGLSTCIALNKGMSGGGVDVIITYLGIRRGHKIGMYNFYINGVILLAGGIIFREWAAMLYTIVYIFVSSQVVNALYRRNNKMLIKIITVKKDEMGEMLLKVSKHGISIYECEGAYTHTKRYELETVVLENEVKDMIKKIYDVDKKAFLTVLNVHEVKGRFHMPEFK